MCVVGYICFCEVGIIYICCVGFVGVIVVVVIIVVIYFYFVVYYIDICYVIDIGGILSCVILYSLGIVWVFCRICCHYIIVGLSTRVSVLVYVVRFVDLSVCVIIVVRVGLGSVWYVVGVDVGIVWVCVFDY